MKINISKEWCLKMAAAEGDVPISAGVPDESCEVCSKSLAEGDLGHRCSDGPVLCEDHAPTWGDLLRQYVDAAGETTSDRSPDELAEDQAEAQARVDAGEGDKKHVWPL